MIPRPPSSTRTDPLFPCTALFRSWRSDLGLPGDDGLTLLVHAAAVEDEDAALGLLFRHRDGCGDHVIDANRADEAQRLAEIDRPRPGQLGPEHRGDETAAPHAMGDDPLKAIRLRKVVIEMRRVHVRSHERSVVIECVSTCGSRWLRSLEKKKHSTTKH